MYSTMLKLLFTLLFFAYSLRGKSATYFGSVIKQNYSVSEFNVVFKNEKLLKTHNVQL